MEETASTEPKKGTSILMGIIGVLFLLFLGGSTYYYMNQKAATSESAIVEPTPVPATPTVTLVPITKATSSSATMPVEKKEESTVSATPKK